MTYERIRELISARMASFAGMTREQIDYPNQPTVFDPPETGLWCRLNIQYATAFMAGMADKPYTRKPGQIVFQCFARRRTHMKSITALADALEAHFGYWSVGDLECMEVSQAVVGDDGNGFFEIIRDVLAFC